MTRRLVRALLAVLSLLVLATGGPVAAQDRLAEETATAEAFVDKLVQDERWAGVRNLIGAAKGLAIITDVKKAAFVVGYESGDGILISRFGSEWSDPLAIDMSATSLAFQAGAQNADILMVILTRRAMTELVEGVFKVGGSGGFALADWGASGRAGGSFGGGVEVLTLSLADGLFAGGGLEGLTLALDEESNSGAYGDDDHDVLSEPGGQFQPASNLRATLSEMVERSWRE